MAMTCVIPLCSQTLNPMSGYELSVTDTDPQDFNQSFLQRETHLYPLRTFTDDQNTDKKIAYRNLFFFFFFCYEAGALITWKAK